MLRSLRFEGAAILRRRFLAAVPGVFLAALLVSSSCSRDADTLRKKAEHGDPAAQFGLAAAYANGKGVPQDHVEAAKWLRRAAGQGHLQARFNLGVACANGLGVPLDDVEAAKWHRMAAEQGHPQAQASLGVAYRTGRGVPRDDLQAYFWFSLAADGSPGKAPDWVARAKDQAAKTLSSEQRMEAQRRIAGWKAAHRGK